MLNRRRALLAFLSAPFAAGAAVACTQKPAIGSLLEGIASKPLNAARDVSKALSTVDLISTYIQPAMLAFAEQVETDLLALGPLATFNAAQGASNTAPICLSRTDDV